MRKRFQELTIQDSFMFAAVMEDEEICRNLLERILQMPIEKVNVVTERTITYHAEYHGVRLDVLADENGKKRRFNVEMQVKSEYDIAKRSRYYHSQMDMDSLLMGRDYDTLPETYVIFICCFDPFGDKQCCYHFENRCRETGKELKDGNYTVFLNTKGEKSDDLPEGISNFLHYVENPEKIDSEDVFLQHLQKKICHIKHNRDWEAKFMLLELTLKKEREEGREEGREQERQYNLQKTREWIFRTLRKKTEQIPKDLEVMIQMEQNSEILDRWLEEAFDARNIEEFKENLK